MQEMEELRRQGISIQAISELTGHDRKTIRKYLNKPGQVPKYGPRKPRVSKLDPFRPYIEERLKAGVWNPVFFDFARYWGFTPRVCQPYRAQTKGKIESGVKYIRRNFLCGRTATSLADLNNQLRSWVWEVANRRVHGTTHRVVRESWEAEKASLQPLGKRPSYPYADDELRRVSRDAFVA